MPSSREWGFQKGFAEGSEKGLQNVSCSGVLEGQRVLRTKCTVSRRWFAVEVCDSFTRSNCTQRFFLGNRLRFLCGNDTVAVAMHFAMRNGQICFSHRVLQGAAQRGAQFYFIFAVLRTLLSCSKMSLFYLKTCTPLKATPWSTAWFSLRKFLAISPAIQKNTSDCGCDAVVHLVSERFLEGGFWEGGFQKVYSEGRNTSLSTVVRPLRQGLGTHHESSFFLWPKCSQRCLFLTPSRDESPVKVELIFKGVTESQPIQTPMKTKWFKFRPENVP